MISPPFIKRPRAFTPVAAAKTAITDRGRKTALACGITLIGFVRDTGTKINTDMAVLITKHRGMKIYTGPERTTCCDEMGISQ